MPERHDRLVVGEVSLAQFVRFRRRELSLTEEELANRRNPRRQPGISSWDLYRRMYPDVLSPSALRFIEQGRTRHPHRNTLAALARGLELGDDEAADFTMTYAGPTNRRP